MERGVIHEIIKVEKEIHEKIKAEERKAREHIENVRKETEIYVAGEEKRLKDELNQTIESAREEAVKKAEKMVANAAALAAQIKGLDNSSLEKIFLKHIDKILPEE